MAGSDVGYRLYGAGLVDEGVAFSRFADCCTAPAPDRQNAVIFLDTVDYASEQWWQIRVATGEILSQGGLPLAVNHAAYAPDRNVVAVTGGSGEVMTIDLAKSEETIAPTISHAARGLYIRFSPDGSKVVSGAEDGTVSLWDARTLELLGTVSIADGVHPPVAAIPTFVDGNDVVRIASHDGQIYHWDTRLTNAITRACTMAGRNLTPAEWTQAFGDRPYEKTCP
ncbi:WD40 repeat domain-containing protein [Kribbella sp. NPDC002412]